MKDELDFSLLDALTSHSEPFGDGGEYKTMPEPQKPAQAHPDAPQAAHGKLAAGQTEDEAEKGAAGQQAEACRACQEAIRRGGALMDGMTKGIANGDDPVRLLLAACEAISAMTGDKLFLEQNRKNLMAIYGAGLSQPIPLEMELQEVQARLERLTRPELENEPPNCRRRIDAAIKAHRERVAALEQSIQGVMGACKAQFWEGGRSDGKLLGG